MQTLQHLIVLAYAFATPAAAGLLRLRKPLSLIKQPINAHEFQEDVHAMHRWQDSPAGASSPCHPRCVWHCTDPVCDQTCEPVCAAPKCQVTCPQITADYCSESCDEPDCAVICPKKANCTMHACQECTTVCKKASCKMACSAPPCQSACEDPHCEWICKKPEKCPKPDCQMQCEQPKGCMIGGPNRPLPEVVDAIIRSQSIAKLDGSGMGELEKAKPIPPKKF